MNLRERHRLLNALAVLDVLMETWPYDTAQERRLYRLLLNIHWTVEKELEDDAQAKSR